MALMRNAIGFLHWLVSLPVGIFTLIRLRNEVGDDEEA